MSQRYPRQSSQISNTDTSVAASEYSRAGSSARVSRASRTSASASPRLSAAARATPCDVSPRSGLASASSTLNTRLPSTSTPTPSGTGAVVTCSGPPRSTTSRMTDSMPRTRSAGVTPKLWARSVTIGRLAIASSAGSTTGAASGFASPCATAPPAASTSSQGRQNANRRSDLPRNQRCSATGISVCPSSGYRRQRSRPTDTDANATRCARVAVSAATRYGRRLRRSGPPPCGAAPRVHAGHR